MNHPEDKKAATRFADAWAKEIDGKRDYRLVRAFLAGCTHVRTSAEWKAMEGVMRASRKVLVDTVRCEFAEGPHQYFITAWSYQGFVAALQELDRIRGDK